jgi:phosphatidylserine synthase 2
MGTQTWVVITIITTEVLICLKFDWETVTKPFPPDIAFYWKIFGSILTLWTVWQFYVWPYINHKKHIKATEEKENKNK